MLSSLPSLAPRDSQSLWYTPLHSNTRPITLSEAPSHAFDHHHPSAAQHSHQHQHHPHRRHAPHSRTPLTRLRADELYLTRRKANVSNYGSSWIKPPGLTKSLHQLREERREYEEHQEALRREQLAQELAEAEAEGAAEELGEAGEDMDEARDLDDEIPDAEVTGMDASSEDSEGGADDEDDVPRGVLAQRMPEDVYREALVRGEDVGFARPAASPELEEDGDELQEEDLVRGEDDLGMGMDLDADLDGAPEAEEYEHTDTEEELSSDDESVGGAGRRFTAASMVRSDGTQNSLDLSALGSSVLGSSPMGRGGRVVRGD